MSEDLVDMVCSLVSGIVETSFENHVNRAGRRIVRLVHALYVQWHHVDVLPVRSMSVCPVVGEVGHPC
jgi:hypothetical protein